MCEIIGGVLGIPSTDVVVASTGVIGQTLKVDVIEKGVPELFGLLERSDGASDAAAHAIMTTDTVKKECAGEVIIGGKTVRIGGIAKGSGMIHPNMGTMLCFITTDCAVTYELLEDALREVTAKTFNRVTVDGDTSTNDTCVILANGMAGNSLIEWKDEGYETFKEALYQVCRHLSRAIAGDGEGAGRLVTCVMSGARSAEDLKASLAYEDSSPEERDYAAALFTNYAGLPALPAHLKDRVRYDAAQDCYYLARGDPGVNHIPAIYRQIFQGEAPPLGYELLRSCPHLLQFCQAFPRQFGGLSHAVRPLDLQKLKKRLLPQPVQPSEDRPVLAWNLNIVPLHQGNHPLPGFTVKFQHPEHLPGQLRPRRGMAIEVVHSVLVGKSAARLSNVMEEHGQPQDHMVRGRLHPPYGMLPAAPAVPGVVLLQGNQRFQLRPELA